MVRGARYGGGQCEFHANLHGPIIIINDRVNHVGQTGKRVLRVRHKTRARGHGVSNRLAGGRRARFPSRTHFSISM